jgi:hypothetical protein
MQTAATAAPLVPKSVVSSRVALDGIPLGAAGACWGQLRAPKHGRIMVPIYPFSPARHFGPRTALCGSLGENSLGSGIGSDCSPLLMLNSIAF